MSNKYQLIILKTILRFAFGIINVLGIWPYKLVHSNRRIKYSFPKALYSFCFIFLGIFSYIVIGMKLVKSMQRQNKHGNITLGLVSSVHSRIIMVAYLYIYINQNVSATRIEIAYLKCREFVDKMSNLYRSDDINFSGYIVDILLKTIIYEILYGSYFCLNLSQSSDMMAAQPYLALIILFPIVTVRMYMNVFYGVILGINMYFKQLNDSLVALLTKATLVCEQGSSRNHFNRMEKYCRFSDEIDGLSMLYFELIKATKMINSIFSINILLWNTFVLTSLIAKNVYQFVAIMTLYEKPIESSHDFSIIENVAKYLIILLIFYDLLSTASACDRLENEVQRTALILHTAKCDRSVDIRFKRSIDTFSIQILLNKLKISECGLFDLNLFTIQLVITAMTSYSLVLLQFELAEKLEPGE